MAVNGCDCLKNIYGYVYLFRILSWVGVTVENTFMGGCTFLEYIYGWVGVGVCDCLKHIYEWYLSKRHLWMSMIV